MNNPSPKQAIAARLKTARTAAQYKTAKSFAEAHSIPVSTYAAHENASKEIKLAVAQHYADLLNIDFNWLLTGEEEPVLEPHPSSQLSWRAIRLKERHKHALLEENIKAMEERRRAEDELLGDIVAHIAHTLKQREQSFALKEVVILSRQLQAEIIEELDRLHAPLLLDQSMESSIDAYLEQTQMQLS